MPGSRKETDEMRRKIDRSVDRFMGAVRAGKVGTTMIMPPNNGCDFCAKALGKDSHWAYILLDNIRLLEQTNRILVDYGKEWAACDPCATRIEAKEWEQLFLETTQDFLAVKGLDVANPDHRHTIHEIARHKELLWKIIALTIKERIRVEWIESEQRWSFPNQQKDDQPR